MKTWLLCVGVAASLVATGCHGEPERANMTVRARSGALYDVTNTSWTRCENGWPAAGQSYWHAWVFGEGTATIKHEVYTAATDCTGPTDPAEHFQVDMTFEPTGGDRTVGWDPAPPPGYTTTVVATGVTFTVPAPSSMAVKGVAYVDDTTTPALIFVTNPGDTYSSPPPVDGDGYVAVLPTLEHARL